MGGYWGLSCGQAAGRAANLSCRQRVTGGRQRTRAGRQAPTSARLGVDVCLDLQPAALQQCTTQNPHPQPHIHLTRARLTRFHPGRRSHPQVSIQIVELMDHVLSTYDRAISLYTHDQFKRAGAWVRREGLRVDSFGTFPGVHLRG